MIYYLYQVITGRRSGIIPRVICAMLTPFSWLYRLFVKTRRFCYERGILKSKRLPCAVISIGNIVAGGTGKTPAVIAIVQQLQREGKCIAVISRGYKRTTRENVVIVSDGENVLASPEEAGDEAYLLARELLGVPIIVGKDRFQAGYEAITRFKVDTIVVDDGFQHWQLVRDSDIVVVDATQPFGTNRYMPAGILRESPTALRRANLILLTRVDQTAHLASVYEQIRQYAPQTPIVESIHAPHIFRRIGTQETVDMDFLSGKKVLAVCGIGNPQSFVDTLYTLNIAQAKLLDFADHNYYTRSDMERIVTSARATNADLVVTTTKDEQKLLAFCEYPVFVLSIQLKILTGRKLLEQLLIG